MIVIVDHCFFPWWGAVLFWQFLITGVLELALLWFHQFNVDNVVKDVTSNCVLQSTPLLQFSKAARIQYRPKIILSLSVEAQILYLKDFYFFEST